MNLTDNEIIKALECCSKGSSCYMECPYDKGIEDEDMAKCTSELSRDALELINRLKAENERLQEEKETIKSNFECQQIVLGDFDEIIKKQAKKLKTVKAEAIKEFAEKLTEKVEKARQKYQRLCKEQGEKEDEAMNIHFKGIVKLIYNLVKELTEDFKE